MRKQLNANSFVIGTAVINRLRHTGTVINRHTHGSSSFVAHVLPHPNSFVIGPAVIKHTH